MRNNVNIFGNAITVYVFDPNSVKISRVSDVSYLNEPFSFNINAVDAGEGFIRVNIKDPENNDILPEIIEYEDRNYIVSFITNLLG